jgi:hypothetical protein
MQRLRAVHAIGRLAGLVVAAGLLAACGQAGHAPSVQIPSPEAVRTVATSRVLVLVMENKEATDLLGNRSAPYLNRLVRHGGLATRSYAVRHPSLPNYLALTSGSTHGITSDCTSCHVGARSIADQLEAAHLRWRAYMEDVPRPCFRAATAGGYAKKHDPFMYYDAVARHASRCRDVVSFRRLARDLEQGALPAYGFVSPNLCHDTHDCSIAKGDRFLSHLVPALLRAVGPHGYLVLTWDEGSSDAGCCGGSNGGRVVTVVAGPDVRAGSRSNVPVDHYGVLGTIQDSLGLPRLGASADAVHGSLWGLFRRHARIR